MKIRLWPFTLAVTALIIIAIYGFKAMTNKPAVVKTGNGFALVELFTSEGCSSCPPADKLIADLSSKKTDNIYILSYHVDYWDRLGWKDAFSDPTFSARQRQYAQYFSNESVYTPQVIVNGLTEFVGSDEGKLKSTIAAGLQSNIKSDISINASKVSNSITVSYNIAEEELVLLNIVLVQPEATINVKRGENGGRMLHHVNIARQFKTIDAKGSGEITIEIPKELSGIPLEVVAFTQSKSNFGVLGADKKVIVI